MSRLPPPPAERVLVERVPLLGGDRVLCTSLGRAQLAKAAARASSSSRVTVFFLDVYRAAAAHDEEGPLPPNLEVVCASDFPVEVYDTIAVPLSAHGEAELAQDLLQQAHDRLKPGGRLVTAVDNADDWWLRRELERLFGRAQRTVVPGVALYAAAKGAPLRKHKQFGAEFAFRDRGRLIRAYSRPGVFAHRRIDPGARHLINAMNIAEGSRVLDLGCGSGVVTLAAACRAADVRVHAVDANPRAVECTLSGAGLNGLSNITAELDDCAHCSQPGSFQLVLANPPYYSYFRIAELFLQVASEALVPGGQVLVVTKSPSWYAENMSLWFEDVTISPAKQYFLVAGRQRF